MTKVEKLLVNKDQDFDTICLVNKMLISLMKEKLLDVESTKKVEKFWLTKTAALILYAML